MRSVVAPCPSCAAPVEFTISSSLVTVCEFCRSVVARGDRKLEDHGKVADLVETASPLHLGLQGKYRGKPFELVGRVQFRHAAGGVWDEWYAAFRNRRWGWLAEAQGKFYLTFEKKISGKSKSRLPALDELEVGRRFAFPKVGKLTVTEINRTQALGAEGEIPFSLVPNAEHDYADLSGPDGQFATFDYGESPPAIYVGKEVTLEAIGVSEEVRAEHEARKVSALGVSCPQCGGALELRAPDQTERVCCPNCASLLDVNQGNLEYLSTLNFGRKSKPVIPIGTVGTLFDTEYTVIGYMRRSVTYAGRDYLWSEYLLYQPREGFRWLINSEGHWSFASPVSAGDVDELGSTAKYDGKKFKLFEHAVATVRYVLGEFYWKVSAGEQTLNDDYISLSLPPHMLSVEKSLPMNVDGTSTGEINYTLATYLPHDQLQQAFNIDELRRGWKVAPNQPSPVDRRMYGYWALFAAVLFVLYLLFEATLSKGMDGWVLVWALAFVSLMPIGTAFYEHSFEVSRWKDSDFNPYASDDD